EPVLRLPRPQPAAAHPRSQPELRASPPDLRASAHSRGRAGEATVHMPMRTPTLLDAPGMARPALRSTSQPVVHTLPAQRGGPTSYEQAAPSFDHYAQHTPSLGELAIDDPDLVLLTRGKRPLGRILAVLVALVLATLVSLYFFVVRPRQHDAELARVRSSALSAVPATDSMEERADSSEGSTAAASMRALLERAAAAQDTPKPLANVPVVTPLEPAVASLEPAARESAAREPAATAQALSPAQADQPVERAHRSHRAHHRRQELKARSDESTRAADAENETEAEVARAPSAAARPRAVEKPEPVKAPAVIVPRPVAAPKPTANEQDLDLDSLLNKAVKSSNGVAAQEDPILGL
ncbi:MAG: hypothetical protein JWN48_1234, partial [Myxococcaceae bacterium]|nr:hypothetical protein [Myxococcaceae bacterium]